MLAAMSIQVSMSMPVPMPAPLPRAHLVLSCPKQEISQCRFSLLVRSSENVQAVGNASIATLHAPPVKPLLSPLSAALTLREFC